MNNELNLFRKKLAESYPEIEAVAYEDPNQDNVWRLKLGTERVGAAMDEDMAVRLAACWNLAKNIKTEDLADVAEMVQNSEKWELYTIPSK